MKTVGNTRICVSLQAWRNRRQGVFRPTGGNLIQSPKFRLVGDRVTCTETDIRVLRHSKAHEDASSGEDDGPYTLRSAIYRGYLPSSWTSSSRLPRYKETTFGSFIKSRPLPE